MSQNFVHLVDLSSIQLDESNGTPSSWVHSLPVGEYTHPLYGKLSMSMDRIKRFADSVKNKVRGIDPSINYNHNNEDIAAGWVKDAKTETNGLWLFVEWTTKAVEHIKKREYKYFSAEFDSLWKNPTGQEFQDVLFGGALTNRPWMKDLLPINLSEDTINLSFELVDVITKAREGAKEDMDLKRLNELLGLPENTSLEDAFKKLAEGKTPDADKDKDTKLPIVPKVSVSDELKALAEENPVVRTLIDTVDAQNTALREFQTGLLEAEVSKKLAEFDKSKIVLTPRAKDLVHDLLIDMPVNLHEKLWDVLSLLRSNSGLMVELGERAGANPRYGSAKDSVTLFMDEVNRYAQEKKVSFDEAMTHISREHPELWNGYRQGTYAFKE